MKRQREKNYWKKLKEVHHSGRGARSRATALRTYEHISHVLVDKEEEGYVVRYSAARWWLQELEQARIKI